MHREDAAWLAGLIDGEGCLDSPRGNARLRIKMTDLDVVLRAASIMGASTYGEPGFKAGYKPCLVAQLTGERAVEVMLAVLPWMGARRSAKITEIVMAHTAKRSRKLHPIHEELAA